jgi:hypothetical protein
MMCASNAAWCSLQSAMPFGIDWDAAGMSIREDVRRFEELLVSESADGTVFTVSRYDSLTEGSLMQPFLNAGCDVAAGSLTTIFSDMIGACGKAHAIVDKHCEGQGARIVVHHVDGPFGLIPARHDPVEVDQWQSSQHGETDARVVAMVGVSPSVPISDSVVSNLGRGLRSRPLLD